MAILARRSGNGRRRMMADINVVPYIDVMLVLVVILMVAAPFVQPSLVDLPTVGKASRAPDAPIAVFVFANGTFKLRDKAGERTIDLPGIISAVTDRQRAEPDTPVVIYGDKAARYEDVTKVMNELYKARVRRVGLAVVNPATPPG
ncbi:MAG TPA: biopolymer transporter ExbD [Burkholderiaceae bacterium]|nr:biopolymer transporter ExbD [Burkholderiaceae bacterium]